MYLTVQHTKVLNVKKIQQLFFTFNSSVRSSNIWVSYIHNFTQKCYYLLLIPTHFWSCTFQSELADGSKESNSKSAGGVELAFWQLSSTLSHPKTAIETFKVILTFWVCGWNPMVWLFKSGLFSGALTVMVLFIFKYFTKWNLEFDLNFDFRHSWEWKG